MASILAFLAACTWLVGMRLHVVIAPQFQGILFFHGFVWFAIPFVVLLTQSVLFPAAASAPAAINPSPARSSE